MAELKGEKLDLLKKKEELNDEYIAMKAEDPGRDHLLSRIRYYEQELNTEYFKLLEDKGEQKPVVPKPDIPKMINDKHAIRVREEEERVANIKRQAAEDNERFMESEPAQQARTFEEEQAQREADFEAREEEYKRQEEERYARREEGKSSSVIPAAIPKAAEVHSSSEDESNKKEYVAGAAPGTDSESESEFQAKIRGHRQKTPFKWTTDREELLEELLIQHSFDFKATSRDFTRRINKDTLNYYQLDVKTL